MTDKYAIEWLRDCAWRGWLRDTLTGAVYSHHGQRWASASDLVKWLQSLPKWPRVQGRGLESGRNIPRRA